MATWTTPITWVTGAVTAAQFNAHIRDNETWLKGAFTQLNVTSDSAKAKITPALVGSRVYRTADQSITSSVMTVVNFDNERFDSDAFHDNVTNNSRFTIPASMGGYYMIGGTVEWASNATGRRDIHIWVGGIASGLQIAFHSTAPNAAAAAFLTTSTLYQLAATDFLDLGVFQTSGGALAVTARGNASPEFWIHRISST